MKQFELDFSAPAAVLKSNICYPYADAKVYKVKRYSSFVIINKNSKIYCGTPEQVKDWAKENGLSLIPKNARGRKFFEYTIN